MVVEVAPSLSVAATTKLRVPGEEVLTVAPAATVPVQAVIVTGAAAEQLKRAFSARPWA